MRPFIATLVLATLPTPALADASTPMYPASAASPARSSDLASARVSGERPAREGPDVTRERGNVDGRFTMTSHRVVAGEPIIARLEVTARAPLRVYVGGDQRNMGLFPTRIGVRVVDEHGAVVCDSVRAPGFPASAASAASAASPPARCFTKPQFSTECARRWPRPATIA
jgi:hypothetical protein